MRTVLGMFALVLILILGHSEAQAQTTSEGWTPNDLSILLPLPKDLERDPMLKAGDLGAHGELVPFSNYASLPILAPVFRKKESEFASLRAVGFRIDPCFPTKPGMCTRQVRIVWQPLLNDPLKNEIVTVDAGVHTFYDLTETEFQSMLKALSKLKKAQGLTTEGPLWIHPAFLKQGLSGPFAREFHQILLARIGLKNLSRMTFMLVRGDSILWAFGGVNFDKGVPTTIHIPRLEQPVFTPMQTFVNRSFSTDDFQKSQVSPAPSGKDTFNLLMRDSGKIRPIEDREEIVESVASIYRIENPDYHSSETLDCVSCHVAHAARGYAVGKWGMLGFPQTVHDLAYKSKFDLRAVSPQMWFTTNLHAFSYFQEEPSISQRVINEAAAVAASVNAMFGH